MWLWVHPRRRYIWFSSNYECNNASIVDAWKPTRYFTLRHRWPTNCRGIDASSGGEQTNFASAAVEKPTRRIPTMTSMIKLSTIMERPCVNRPSIVSIVSTWRCKRRPNNTGSNDFLFKFLLLWFWFFSFKLGMISFRIYISGSFNWRKWSSLNEFIQKVCAFAETWRIGCFRGSGRGTMAAAALLSAVMDNRLPLRHERSEILWQSTIIT